MSCHSLLAWRVSTDRSAVILLGIPLCVICCFWDPLIFLRFVYILNTWEHSFLWRCSPSCFFSRALLIHFFHILDKDMGTQEYVSTMLQIMVQAGIVCVCAKLFQFCLTLCNPMDHRPPGSSSHGILQARILGWVAMRSSRGSSRPRDRTHISYVSCLVRRVLYH